MSYHPSLPEVVHRFEPDAEYHEKLEEALGPFLTELDVLKAKYEAHRVPRVWGDPAWRGTA
jgi:hypothetical protein